MKSQTLVLLFGLFSLSGLAQDSTKNKNDYNVFSSFQCKDCREKYFVSTNSGLLHTPIGLRVGFLGKKGFYLGGRYGNGTIYNSEVNATTDTKLFSITTGLILPIYIKNRFSVHTYFGGGYGQWFDKRWDTWTKSGIEVEGGFMVSYKKVSLSFGATVLNGEKTYAIGDGTLGLGIRF
jgi:hypothetical protein